jgi:high-affinity Fe2+/Pb2+ permease
MVLETEKAEWKSFRNALNNKKERKEFDDMFDIPRSYLPACSNSVSLVPLQPIFISILFHHYKEVMELKAQVEQIIGDNNKRVRVEMSLLLLLLLLLLIIIMIVVRWTVTYSLYD